MQKIVMKLETMHFRGNPSRKCLPQSMIALFQGNPCLCKNTINSQNSEILKINFNMMVGRLLLYYSVIIKPLRAMPKHVP